MPPARKEAEPGTPVEASDPATEAPSDTVTLAVGHPYDELVLHDVKGMDDKPLVITAAGTEVPTSLEDAVKKAAKDADAPIRKVR